MKGRSAPAGPPREPEKTLPDRIADELLARIFTGELRPGDLLPAERTLATQLGVDRTSLRMALRQLTRMKLVRAVRGSGITVLDYRTHAGIDFLSAVLEVPGLQLGGAMLLEFLDHWSAVVPQVTALALTRATPSDFAAIDALFAEQLRALHERQPLEAVAELEVRIQDQMFALAGSVALGLLANSTRPLRRSLTQLSFELGDPRAQVLTQRAAVRAAAGAPPDPQRLLAAHRAYLRENSQPLRRHLASLPPCPHRTRRFPF